jgi:hypothetical protein
MRNHPPPLDHVAGDPPVTNPERCRHILVQRKLAHLAGLAARPCSPSLIVAIIRLTASHQVNMTRPGL